MFFFLLMLEVELNKRYAGALDFSLRIKGCLFFFASSQRLVVNQPFYFFLRCLIHTWVTGAAGACPSYVRALFYLLIGKKNHFSGQKQHDFLSELKIKMKS